MRRLLVLASAAAAALAVAATTPADGAPSADLGAYRGPGIWVSIYDRDAWRRPEQVVARLAARHVHTLFLQTGNYRQRTALVRPQALGRFLDAAHEEGIAVVAWYLPSLAGLSRDLARARAALAFRSPGGAGFDSFALDLEATVVRSFARRSAQAVRLAAAVRRSAPARYPLGAITIDPVGSSPSYWPAFPFRALGRSVDVFLPMEYFTARVRGAARIAAYAAANIRYIRDRAGADFPIHPIGGEALHATPAQIAAFRAAASACRVVGTSLWEYGQMTGGRWDALLREPAAPGRC